MPTAGFPPVPPRQTPGDDDCRAGVVTVVAGWRGVVLPRSLAAHGKGSCPSPPASLRSFAIAAIHSILLHFPIVIEGVLSLEFSPPTYPIP